MRHIVGSVALVAILGCGGGEGAEDVLQPDIGGDTGQDVSGLPEDTGKDTIEPQDIGPEAGDPSAGDVQDEPHDSVTTDDEPSFEDAPVTELALDTSGIDPSEDIPDPSGWLTILPAEAAWSDSGLFHRIHPDRGLQVVSVQDPTNMDLVSQTHVTGRAEQLFLRNGYDVLVGLGCSTETIDGMNKGETWARVEIAEDPEVPGWRLGKGKTLPGKPEDSVIVGDYLLLGTLQGNLARVHSVDLKTAPVVGSVDTYELPYTPLFMSAAEGGLLIGSQYDSQQKSFVRLVLVGVDPWGGPMVKWEWQSPEVAGELRGIGTWNGQHFALVGAKGDQPAEIHVVIDGSPDAQVVELPEGFAPDSWKHRGKWIAATNYAEDCWEYCDPQWDPICPQGNPYCIDWINRTEFVAVRLDGPSGPQVSQKLARKNLCSTPYPLEISGDYLLTTENGNCDPELENEIRDIGVIDLAGFPELEIRYVILWDTFDIFGFVEGSHLYLGGRIMIYPYEAKSRLNAYSLDGSENITELGSIWIDGNGYTPPPGLDELSLLYNDQGIVRVGSSGDGSPVQLGTLPIARDVRVNVVGDYVAVAVEEPDGTKSHSIRVLDPVFPLETKPMASIDANCGYAYGSGARIHCVNFDPYQTYTGVSVYDFSQPLVPKTWTATAFPDELPMFYWEWDGILVDQTWFWTVNQNGETKLHGLDLSKEGEHKTLYGPDVGYKKLRIDFGREGVLGIRASTKKTGDQGYALAFLDVSNPPEIDVLQVGTVPDDAAGEKVLGLFHDNIAVTGEIPAVTQELTLRTRVLTGDSYTLVDEELLNVGPQYDDWMGYDDFPLFLGDLAYVMTRCPADAPDCPFASTLRVLRIEDSGAINSVCEVGLDDVYQQKWLYPGHLVTEVEGYKPEGADDLWFREMLVFDLSDSEKPVPIVSFYPNTVGLPARGGLPGGRFIMGYLESGVESFPIP